MLAPLTYRELKTANRAVRSFRYQGRDSPDRGQFARLTDYVTERREVLRQMDDTVHQMLIRREWTRRFQRL